jgi:hypothetical protein
MSMSHRVMGALKPLTALAAGGLLSVATGFGQPAHAQAAVAGYVGTADSSVAGCPWLAWRLARKNERAGRSPGSLTTPMPAALAR